MKSVLLNILALGPVASIQAHAEIYMTEEAATKSLFPGEKFDKAQIELDPKQIEKLTKESGERVRSGAVKVYKSKNKDTVFIDQVLGKHEMITYAVGIDRGGKVKGLEILEYRETYGNQVKEENWKQQFVGKTKISPLKLNEDIKGISGATLSSAHVTAGVRRLLHTYDQIKAQI
jgi:Na+-translocating ferredoxin:NAD+ oxidoreductase RnfG subunit